VCKGTHGVARRDWRAGKGLRDPKNGVNRPHTIPSCLKAWVDHVLRIHHTFAPSPEGKRGLLHDRPVYIAVASGGFYTGARANQPDFVTPYLQAALNTMGLHTLRFFPLQGLVFGPERVAQAWSEATAALDAVLAPQGANALPA
jgi:FMN-dependent NADH-azoreductase